MAQRGKMIDDSALTGAAGIALIARRVSQMKQVWHERQIDPGIDGTVELRDPLTGEMSNRHILVQSKARTRFAGETDDRFHFVCDDRDVDYWMKADNPVILVCSHPESGEAWWVHIQTWFNDPAHRASLRVDFNKATQKFDSATLSKLFAVADPHGRAHTPAHLERRETLLSNLVPVSFPEVFYSAHTNARKRHHVDANQAKTSHPRRSDFALRNGRIYTWAPIAGTALSRTATTAANERSVGELLDGSDDDRRLLVSLLNQALEHDLRGTCDWHRGRRFLYFRAPDDLSERRVLSDSGRRRIAFKGYYKRRDDPTRAQFYRHAAMRRRFIDIDGGWYLTVIPDYLFTSDGYRESPFADEYLAKLKVRERNRAVLGETQLWIGLLRGIGEPNLLDGLDLFTASDINDPSSRPDRSGAGSEFSNSERCILDFGAPSTFDVERGIDDAMWQAPAPLVFEDDQDGFDFEDDG